jgi:hypothetical protein
MAMVNERFSGELAAFLSAFFWEATMKIWRQDIPSPDALGTELFDACSLAVTVTVEAHDLL